MEQPKHTGKITVLLNMKKNTMLMKKNDKVTCKVYFLQQQCTKCSGKDI